MSVIRRNRPSGTVTFLLTDVESSSEAWMRDSRTMDSALRHLDREIVAAVESNGGHVIKQRGEGDSHFATFRAPSSALVAAHGIQVASGGSAAALRVRVGVHTGEVAVRNGDYFGITPNRAARIRSLGHGGQIVASAVTAHLAQDHLPADLRLTSLGVYRVRDFISPVEVFQLHGPGLEDNFPSLRTLDSADGLTTVVCVDAVGTTHRIAPFTDQAVVEWTQLLVSLIRNAAGEPGPAFLKFVGDGCVAGFPSPTAAINFVARFREAADAHGISVRAGVDASCITVVHGEPVGAAMFGAVVLAAKAKPGTTAMSSVLEGLLQRERADVSVGGQQRG